MVDLTGQKFGRLTVMKMVTDYTKFSDKRKDMWECKCECGLASSEMPIVVRGTYLRNGHTKSCGCLKKEANAKHGKSGTRIYRIWNKMKSRCYSQNEKCYKDYGGRGIEVCKEWLDDFNAFYDWAISHGYTDELSIDRIDVNDNYTPQNCRWATRKEQSNNLRRNHIITFGNEKKTVSEWCEVTGLKYETIIARERMGWCTEDILFKPKNKPPKTAVKVHCTELNTATSTLKSMQLLLVEKGYTTNTSSGKLCELLKQSPDGKCKYLGLHFEIV